jgi:predicted lipid-binding transport protein (Tim44 family)
MRGTPIERKSRSPAIDRLRLADVSKTILSAMAGALGGTVFGAIYGSMATMLFGAMGGAIAGMILHELDCDNQL